MGLIFSFFNTVLGSQVLGRVIMLALDWYLNKKNTDRESRELAVSLAMSLRKQGVTDVIMSYSSDNDAKRADQMWDEIEEKNKDEGEK